MLKRGMDSKGQLSVEYLFLLMIILVVFGFMVTNFIGPSIDASNDISDVSAASNAINSLANAAGIVYSNGPNSKRNLTFYIPYNTNITTSYVSASKGMYRAIIALPDGTNETVNASTPWPLDSHTFVLTKGSYNASITWGASTFAISTKINKIG